MASALVGAVVGTFKVGDGTKVGVTTFQADKPKIILKGKAFSTLAVQDLKQMVVGKPKLTLLGKTVLPEVSGGPIFTTTSRLTLRGKAYRYVIPTKAVLGRGKMNLRGRSYVVGLSVTVVVGKPKIILEGKEIAKAGRAGMIPSAPRTILLTPTGAVSTGFLVPSPMPTAVSDDFNRADENPLSGGGNWSGRMFPEGGLPLKLVGNQAVPQGLWADRLWATPFPADQEVFVTLTSTLVVGGSSIVVLGVRQTYDLHSGYDAWFSADSFGIEKVVHDAWTSDIYDSPVFGVGWIGPGDQLCLSAVGNVISVLVNGVVRGYVVDTDIPNGGQIGFYLQNATADNFGGGTAPLRPHSLTPTVADFV